MLFIRGFIKELSVQLHSEYGRYCRNFRQMYHLQKQGLPWT
ncbi:MAG: hypothetical protein ACLT2J_04065 [[Clostridium] innocuum]